MKKNHTEIVCILDRSGSMDSIKTDTIGSFNTFIESQKKVPGTASATLVLFDDQYETLFKGIELNKVEPLTDKTFIPRGMTALYDAIGKTINELGDMFTKEKEENRPEKVMVCIITDGAENSSKEFKQSQIKEMITHQRDKYKWEFAFLAANQDAFLEGGNMGISKQFTSSYAATGAGVRMAGATMDSMSTSYRIN